MFESTDFVERLRRMETSEVQRVYARWEAIENRARARRQLTLGVLDERHVGATGAQDTEEWVATESKLTSRHAHAEVRSARKLLEQPAVANAAAAGELSWDQLDPLTRFVTPDGDERWARRAPEYTPDQLAAVARRSKAVTAKEAADRRDRLTLRWWEHDGGTAIRGWLPDVDGATFVKGIERQMERAGKGPDGSWSTHERRAADALVALASQRIAADADPDRACVTVTVPEAALHAARADVPGAELDDLEIALAAETVRRLTCDSSCQLLIESSDGTPIGLGRKTRSVPRWLSRHLRRRDHHCRGPGCDRTRGLRAHHIEHWADGGPTDPDNLVLLCPRCHALVHEHRWSMRGDPARPDGLVYQSPDGRILGARDSTVLVA